ncbi:MAG: hypothetical protein KDD45_09730, partial [Bdellovibrionales bacterium]|nr:hypothetical protein [Bdellovibrionales bacterium]
MKRIRLNFIVTIIISLILSLPVWSANSPMIKKIKPTTSSYLSDEKKEIISDLRRQLLIYIEGMQAYYSTLHNCIDKLSEYNHEWTSKDPLCTVHFEKLKVGQEKLKDLRVFLSLSNLKDVSWKMANGESFFENANLVKLINWRLTNFPKVLFMNSVTASKMNPLSQNEYYEAYFILKRNIYNACLTWSDFDHTKKYLKYFNQTSDLNIEKFDTSICDLL